MSALRRGWLLAIGAAICCAGSSTAADAQPAPWHLFILSGQSNMEKLDPQVSFTPAVTKGLKPDQVVVVKDALGGQPMSRWYKKWQAPKGAVRHVNPDAKPAGAAAATTTVPANKAPAAAPAAPVLPGDLYDRLMTKVRPELAKRSPPATITFVWMQGERDAKDGTSAVYAESLRGLIAQLRGDLKRQDINFVIGRLSDARDYPAWQAIREAEVAVAGSDPHGAWINTDDLNGERNGIHCTREGYATMGNRFAEKSLGLIHRAKNH